MKKTSWTLTGAGLLVFVFGIGFFSGRTGNKEEIHPVEIRQEESPVSGWTCAMHPQIHLPKPGKCPICFMDLIPVEEGIQTTGEWSLAMSESAKKLAEIETTPVRRQNVALEIRLVGKVDYDETRNKIVSARVMGRLERLFVDYTGVSVKKGEHLVEIFSPELYGTQEELLQSFKSYQTLNTPNTAAENLKSAHATYQAAREKLMQLGLTKEQIEQIVKEGRAKDRLMITSPISGVVYHKAAVEGMQVMPGEMLYKIADLSQVWVILEAYESDLSWIKYGQSVEFTAEALPGETFYGRVGFIDPYLQEGGRTVRVRVNAANLQHKLKPGLFVTGTVFAKLSHIGRVVDDYLADKWICPMHPEIIKKKPGSCDLCGMDLVSGKSLGFTRSPAGSQNPLVIPVSAALVTGKRAIVYVEMPGQTQPTFEGREVILGPRAGDFYIVEKGLVEGERVVSHGAFKIDSELQIRAKPSMLNPPKSGKDQLEKVDSSERRLSSESVPAHENQLNIYPYFTAYFRVANALAQDQEKKAVQELKQLKVLIEGSPEKNKNRATRQTLAQQLEHLDHLQTAGQVRDVFNDVSKSLIEFRKQIKNKADLPKSILVYCPMALDGQGAHWLQADKNIRNPYMGQAMLSCGTIQDEK